MTRRKSKHVVDIVGMRRYFVTKWASIVLGTGAFFVSLGLLISTNLIVLCPPEPYTGATTFPVTPLACLATPQKFELTYSLFFYGGLQMAIGISVLILQNFRRQKSGDTVLLNNLIDQGV